MNKLANPLNLSTATLITATLSLAAVTTTSCAQSKNPSKNPQVTFETTVGNFTLELYPDKAPVTVKNFLTYVEEGFYEDTIFHRVIGNFMAQGGGFDAKMKQKKTHKPIKNEADNGLKNDVGTVAMARTNDPDSASSQFFINFKNNDFLNHRDKSTNGWGYCVFGKVVEGMDVVAKMGKVKTVTVGPFRDVPKEPIVVKKVTLKK